MKFLKEAVGYEPNETSELMAKIGKDHGYDIIAYNAQYQENGKLYPNIWIHASNERKYAPQIYPGRRYSEDFIWEIQTTSYGGLGLDEYREYLTEIQNAYDLVKKLSKIDLSKLPIKKDFK